MYKNTCIILTHLYILILDGFVSAATQIETISYFEKENSNLASIYTISSKYYSGKRKFIVHTPVGYQ